MTKVIGEKLRGVNFIYFDVGNVFYSFSGGLESLAGKLNKPLNEVVSYWRSRDDDICRGKLNPQEFWKEVKTNFNYSGEDMNFVDFWIKHFEKIQKGHDLAYKLSKDYQLGLLTNVYPTVIEAVMKKGLLPEVQWASIVESCGYGFVKPERGLFDVALEKTGFKANEVLLIDDLEINCDKAVEHGWRSILFK